MTLQHRLRDLLSASDMTRSDFAARAGLDPADLSRLLNAATPRFTVRTILRLARGLQKTPTELLAGVDELPERLQEDLAFWLEQFSEAEAAIKERDGLREALNKTLYEIGVRLQDMERRHAEDLAAARAEGDRSRQEAVERTRELASARAQVEALEIQVVALRQWNDDAARQESALIKQVAALREQLATSKQATVATGVLGAIFGAGAGALLGRAATNGAEQDDTSE